MNATEEKIIMSHRLSHARQNEILSKCSWEADGMRVRVVCTHRTEPILRLAGIAKPRACETYMVPVKRDKSAFLIVDLDARAQSASDGELFEAGGLLARMERPNAAPVPPAAFSARAETSQMVAETKALIHDYGKRFEVSTGPHSKIRLIVIALEDKALPSPGEPELWEPTDPSDRDILSAAHALVTAKNLDHFRR